MVNGRGCKGSCPITRMAWAGACWKYYFNVMCGTHVFGQEPGYLGHRGLGGS